MGNGRVLLGDDREAAERAIVANHYTHSIPSGKSHYIGFSDAVVVWSIPANKNIAGFLCCSPGSVWELSRLWAPDGHEKNLLTMAISFAVREIVRLERPEALVSYADPNVGHKGGVYRAASWHYNGTCEESRSYEPVAGGPMLSRRAFHSGKKSMTKEQIEALGYTEVKLPGKERFVRPISKSARRRFP